MTKRKTIKKPAAPIKQKAEEELAARCLDLQKQVAQAGRSLHDHAGPLMSAAGIHLQLLQMDLPTAAARIQEINSMNRRNQIYGYGFYSFCF